MIESRIKHRRNSVRSHGASPLQVNTCTILHIATIPLKDSAQVKEKSTNNTVNVSLVKSVELRYKSAVSGLVLLTKILLR